MRRSWKRRTATHGTFDASLMSEAVEKVISEKSVRAVAEETGLKKSTLNRYVLATQKPAATDNSSSDGVSFKPNYDNPTVFTDEPEKMLADYCLTASRLHYGLSPKECCKLAHEFGVTNKNKLLSS